MATPEADRLVAGATMSSSPPVIVPLPFAVKLAATAEFCPLTRNVYWPLNRASLFVVEEEMVIATEADTEGFATEVAVTMTVVFAVTTAGASYVTVVKVGFERVPPDVPPETVQTT